jgi:hypothetical protein
MKGQQQFNIPKQRDLERFFAERFGRNFSEQERNVMNFFHHQVDKALENMGAERLQFCATMILMLSSAARRNYCLANGSLCADEKRNKFAQTIGAIFLKDLDALNNVIQDSNAALAARLNTLHAREGDNFFENVNLNPNEQSTLQQFCTDYTIFLAKEILSLFSSEESRTWRSAGIPVPHNLMNHQEKRLRILGHSPQEIQQLSSVVPQNP